MMIPTRIRFMGCLLTTKSIISKLSQFSMTPEIGIVSSSKVGNVGDPHQPE
jgi:hypothetical protein